MRTDGQVGRELPQLSGIPPREMPLREREEACRGDADYEARKPRHDTRLHGRKGAGRFGNSGRSCAYNWGCREAPLWTSARGVVRCKTQEEEQSYGRSTAGIIYVMTRTCIYGEEDRGTKARTTSSKHNTHFIVLQNGIEQ
jgi:hypothetical protein